MVPLRARWKKKRGGNVHTILVGGPGKRVWAKLDGETRCVLGAFFAPSLPRNRRGELRAVGAGL